MDDLYNYIAPPGAQMTVTSEKLITSIVGSNPIGDFGLRPRGRKELGHDRHRSNIGRPYSREAIRRTAHGYFTRDL